MTHFLINQKFDPVLYFRGHASAHICKASCACLINVLKKLDQKKLFVTKWQHLVL